MCLSVAVERPDDVLAKGTHVGHEWMVVHNQGGYRCGYVKVLPGHPWHGKGWDDLDGIIVHGGVTFAKADKPCDEGGADDGWWIGFDCAHAWDAPDPSLPSERRHTYTPSDDCVIRDQEYVEAECRSLCEQAAGMET